MCTLNTESYWPNRQPLFKRYNGRLEFRTGAGATPQYAVQWWHPYGIDYPNESVRVSMLREGVEVLNTLWNQQEEDKYATSST
jgi:alkanesulfonate monooxygenase SsuD/methylene tetrahydromethanopterin reductase-like flavin-dependent oxidoreductase (luciferase family)